MFTLICASFGRLSYGHYRKMSISAEAEWIVAQSLKESNVLPEHLCRHTRGRLSGDRDAVKVSNGAGNKASQCIVFMKEGRHVIVQYNVERQLAIFSVINGKLGYSENECL
jgi:hypothetical protein